MCPECKSEIYDTNANYCYNCRHNLKFLAFSCKHCGHGVPVWMLPYSKYCTFCSFSIIEKKNAYLARKQKDMDIERYLIKEELGIGS